MQSNNIQRNSQRRTPTAEGDPRYSSYPTPPTPTQPNYNGGSTNSRGSAGSAGTSARSSSGKKRDPSQQLSQIEKSVTHLLIATKQLLETLTQWSRHQATEGEVSDVYVRLGYEFNIACRAFTSIGVDISDLGNVPDLLRAILEDTLSQDPSPASLDRYLPRIRDIIINLLHGLKRKQQKLRAKQQKDGSTGATRQMSTLSTTSGGSDTITFDDVQNHASAGIADQYGEENEAFGRSYMSTAESSIPQRTSSVPVQSATREFSNQQDILQAGGSLRDSRRGPGSTTFDSSLSSETLQTLPVEPPEDPLPKLPQLSHPPPSDPLPPPPPPPTSDNGIPKDFPAPPPVPTAQPRAQEALAALQRGGDLERRASRRYSAYQIQKHLGQSPSAMNMIPPPQHGPIPNRGKEQRDSLNAVRSRSSLVRQRSSRFADSSPSRSLSERVSSEQTLLDPNQQEPKREGSPLSRQAESVRTTSPTKASMRATLTGPLDLSNADYLPDSSNQELTPVEQHVKNDIDQAVAATADETERLDQPFIPNESPEPGTALTLFLQYRAKIKKYVLSDGANVTIPRLQLAFIEKFSWHINGNGVDLPEIYIQDPVSGVRHELEDLSDIKDRTVLVLNVEAVDEVKRHFDSQLGGLRQAIDSMRNAVETQQSSIKQVSTRQEDTAKEIARLASAPQASPRHLVNGKPQVNGTRALSGGHISEVQTLRRDLAVMRQTLTKFTSDISSSMSAIREQADTVKSKAAIVIAPSLEGDSGRAYVNAGKKTVGDDSEELVNRVDDLQDIVEELRKDVVTRGVRPLPSHLDTVTRDITTATQMLNKMKEMVKKEKPVWTKIWEKELELVCNDREFLTLQEELIADLEDDLEKANQTFSLVNEATKQQHQQQQSGTGVTLRNTSRGFGADTALDPDTAREGVMGEVRALQPNHESRLEAIERAEKARAKELEGRKDGAFKKELGQFVEENKLKKTGGFEEIERMRLVQDQRNLDMTWSVEQEEKARRKKERAEKKAREAAERARIAAEEAQLEGMANEGDLMHEPPPEGEDGGHQFRDGQDYQALAEAVHQNGVEDGVQGADGSRKSWLPSIFTSSI